MGATPDTNPYATVLGILAAQAGVAAAVAALGWGLAGVAGGLSALAGGGICVLPNAFLALRLVAAGAAGDPHRALKATYIGAAGKLVMTAALFAAVFVLFRGLSPGWLFAGFLGAQAVIPLSLLATRGNGSTRQVDG